LSSGDLLVVLLLLAHVLAEFFFVDLPVTPLGVFGDFSSLSASSLRVFLMRFAPRIVSSKVVSRVLFIVF
jgi:hypothetical protein